MNSFLFNRQLGSVSPQALINAQNEQLLQSLQAAPQIQFCLRPRDAPLARNLPTSARDLAHVAGVSSIAIDRFEGRYLLSGGADSSIAIWDLESTTDDVGRSIRYNPLAHKARTSNTENLSITHVSFYPFDSLAFLTSGYDKTLKLCSSETLETSASFDMGFNVYSHATSTIASHLLVACAIHHPAVRLVDLNSGSTAHSLAGHAGAVLTVAWHPKREHILASGATDGCVRLWDIRRSASSLGVLDMEDSIGVAGYDGCGTGARRRERGKSHNGSVNGIVWTDDGRHLVSTGHDERMRVWDAITGANTLANFGPSLKNVQNSATLPLLTPSHLSGAGSQTLYFPNPKEILNFDMHSGALLKRLRIIAPAAASSQNSEIGIRNVANRTTSLCWRAHSVEMYSAHADGTIRCWAPRASADGMDADEHDAEIGDEADRKRKRDELDQIVRDLTGRRDQR